MSVQLQKSKEKQISYTLHVYGSDGNTYHADLSKHRLWLFQHLGLDSIERHIDKLESRIERLEAPIRQKKILDLLKDEVAGRTWRWVERRLDVKFSDRDDLLAEGKIEHFIVGNSHKYRINEA